MKEKLPSFPKDSFENELAAKKFRDAYKEIRHYPLTKYSIEELVNFAKIECYGIETKGRKNFHAENDKQHQLISEIIVEKLLHCNDTDFEKGMKDIN